MKKILWLLILIPIFMTKVQAKTYYSEYSDYYLSNEEVLENDTHLVEKVRYYNWYKTIKKPLKYELYDSSKLYLDDCYYTSPTAFSLTKPDSIDGRIIEENITYVYQIPNKVRYVHLTNLYGSYRSIRITELMVNIGGIDIDYDYECEGCWGEFDEHIHNGIWAENESYIDNGGSLIIDLKEEYLITELDLTFYIFDTANTSKMFTLAFSSDVNYPYASRNYTLNFYTPTASEALKVNKNVYNLPVYDYEWSYKYLSPTKLDTGYLSEYVETSYRYKDKMCMSYINENVYSNVYSDVKIDGYDKYDTDDYIDYYKYKVRDKITVDDNIVITDDNDITDFISSTSDYEISDFDITKNGVYPIVITTPYTQIKTNVTIDTFNNKLKEKDEQISNLNNEYDLLKEQYEKNNAKLNKEIDSLEKENNNYNNELSKLLKEKEDLLNNYNEKLFNINNKLNELKKENEELLNANKLTEQLTLDYENKLVELEKNNKYLTDLNQSYYEQIIEFEEKNVTNNNNIKEVIKHEEELIDYYENKLLVQEQNSKLQEDELLKEISDLKLNNIEVEETHEPNYLLDITKPNSIIFIIMFLIILIVMLKKMSSTKKN